MKYIYRITIRFTEDLYKNTPPSNIFIRAETVKIAEEKAILIFKETLVKHGLVNAKFEYWTSESSDTEVAMYTNNIKNNNSGSHRLLN